MKQRQLLKIKGMSCGHCTGAVKSAIEQFDGIENVIVKLEPGSAEFDFDPTVYKLEELITSIEEEEFEVVR